MQNDQNPYKYRNVELQPASKSETLKNLDFSDQMPQYGTTSHTTEPHAKDTRTSKTKSTKQLRVSHQSDQKSYKLTHCKYRNASPASKTKTLKNLGSCVTSPSAPSNFHATEPPARGTRTKKI